MFTEWQHLLPLLDPEVLRDLLWASLPLLVAGGLMALEALNPALGAGAAVAYAYLSAEEGEGLSDAGKEFGGSGFASALEEGKNATAAGKWIGKTAGGLLEKVGWAEAVKEFGERMGVLIDKYGPQIFQNADRSGAILRESDGRMDRSPSGRSSGGSGAVYEARMVPLSEIFRAQGGWFPSNVDTAFPNWRQFVNDPLLNIPGQ